MDEQLAIRSQAAHIPLARPDEPAASALLHQRRLRPRAQAGASHRTASPEEYSPLRSARTRTLDPNTLRAQLQFDPSVASVFGIKLFSDEHHWTEIAFDINAKQFYIDRTHAGEEVSPDFPARTTAPLVTTRPYDLTLIVDRSSIEAFAQDGTIAMTNLIFPSSSITTIQPIPKAQAIKRISQAWQLKSIWNSIATLPLGLSIRKLRPL